jgi:PPOX class probable F420-dependent enzyme
MIDLTSTFGKRVARRLEEEKIIWLTTVDSRGRPQPRPVWFLWDGENILIFSREAGYKIQHIKNNGKVSLNLDSDGQGGDIVVLLGTAIIENYAIPIEQLEQYLEKYTQGLAQLNMTPEEFQRSYSVVIRISPTLLRGH